MSYDRAIVSKLSSLALDSKHKIIVGVDYGTTFTGASYVSSRGSGLSDIILISTWPGPSRDTETVFKAPSRIAYADENSLLFETASQTGILKLPKGKVAVDVVADYLSEVYQHILKTISKNITEADLRITPLEFWFTVPAIWSDRALDATRTAAQRAGFGKSSLRPMDQIFLISEPEAAAVTALKKYTTSSMGGSVKAGDGVLVCDCGGGTVDITTYLVLDVFPTLKFEELCTGIGGKCGSTAVDRNFYQLMSDRFGDAFDNLPTKRKSPGSEFMKRFEIIKRDFGNSDEETTFELPLNMTVANPEPEFFDEEERLVLISSADLHSIFDPVIDKIVSLVRQQIADARKETGKDIINRIVLVGGFGDSEYLRKAIRSSFGSTGKITITVPDSPQAAIVQGAALRGLEGLQSTTKRCRRHYGFSWGNRFRAGIDSELNAYYDSYSGKKMVSGIMKWMIAKGTTYTDHYTDTVTVYRTHYEDSTLRKFDTFYACDQEEAPEREEDKAVYTVGDIIVDFSNVNLATFPSKVIKDERVYKLSYELKVTVGAREGVLKFEALSQGQTIGQTSINFSAAKYY
ncbi:heat shock 70 kDa protein 12A [Aspergillus udagawae]|uniref:Heat shock 70 kDa protein 12A n=1 Tax=Aspergillus udagawae TaxID=91492 RepID=A0ABQ1BC33_9EURO|nr:heat shock 70 kDa protein 12A [Aspergillus udagawae]